MKTLLECFKGPDSSYYGDCPNWLVVLARHRGSDILENSNFECIKKELESAFTGEDVSTETAGHFAVGWVEYLIINPENTGLKTKAEEILKELEDCPFFDEEDYSRRELEEATEEYDSALKSRSVCRDGISLVPVLELFQKDLQTLFIKRCEAANNFNSAEEFVHFVRIPLLDSDFIEELQEACAYMDADLSADTKSLLGIQVIDADDVEEILQFHCLLAVRNFTNKNQPELPFEEDTAVNANTDTMEGIEP